MNRKHNNFIKLNSSLFDHPRFSRLSQNSKRKGRLLNTIGDFENIDILKEEEGDNLGILKMGMAQNSKRRGGG